MRVAAFARCVDHQQHFPLKLAERDRLILQVHKFVIKDRWARRLRCAAWSCRGQCCERGDDKCVDRSGEHTFLLGRGSVPRERSKISLFFTLCRYSSFILECVSVKPLCGTSG